MEQAPCKALKDRKANKVECFRSFKIERRNQDWLSHISASGQYYKHITIVNDDCRVVRMTF